MTTGVNSAGHLGLGTDQPNRVANNLALTDAFLESSWKVGPPISWCTCWHGLEGLLFAKGRVRVGRYMRGGKAQVHQGGRAGVPMAERKFVLPK
jgi:hypothetical protein